MDNNISDAERELMNNVNQHQEVIDALKDLTKELWGKSYIQPEKIKGKPDAVELKSDRHMQDALDASNQLVDIPTNEEIKAKINAKPKDPSETTSEYDLKMGLRRFRI